MPFGISISIILIIITLLSGCDTTLIGCGESVYVVKGNGRGSTGQERLLCLLESGGADGVLRTAVTDTTIRVFFSLNLNYVTTHLGLLFWGCWELSRKSFYHTTSRNKHMHWADLTHWRNEGQHNENTPVYIFYYIKKSTIPLEFVIWYWNIYIIYIVLYERLWLRR